MSPRRPTLAVAFAACLAALAVLAGASAERASAEGVPIYGVAAGATSDQAGGHPDVFASVAVGTPTTEGQVPCTCNSLRDVIVNMPAGLVGDPISLPRCSAAEIGASQCPVDSQVGVVVIQFTSSFGDVYWLPLYNMVPAGDQLALLANTLPVIGSSSPVYTVISARTESDYGLEFQTISVPSLVPPHKISIITWGVPADPAHDQLRFAFGPGGFGSTGQKYQAASCGDNNPVPELLAGQWPCGTPNPPVPANSVPKPFLSVPTRCAGPLAASFETVGYDLSAAHAETSFPAMVGCDQLGFNPSLVAKPTTTEADSPSGIDVTLTVPQASSATTPAPSSIRKATVTLPPGFTINPNAAGGKAACTAAQARIETREEARCPEFSKIGTLEVESASLPGPLPGAVYLGEPLPGNRYRVILVADGFSLHVKLPGVATPDPASGQLRVSFDDLPQFTFQRFTLHVFGAERGLLATPERCGTYPVHAEYVPWASPHLPNQASTQFFTIDSGPGGSPCPPPDRPFSPALNAGVTDNTGGHHTEFVFELTRKDGDQSLTGVETSNPPGFSAVLAGVPYCPEATLAALGQSSYPGATELGSPACEASRIGASSTSVGSGSRPASLPGNVYLAGPYKGAPLSLAVVTPAVSGPYDLGNVVVRVAVHVDPASARVSATSDPLPQIVEGIPLRLRRALIVLDRPDFALNPTSCDPFSVGARVFGDQGALADLQRPFQVANCGALDFGPRLGLKLRGNSKRRGHPALRAVLRASPGEANLRRTVVAMPKTLLLDNANIRTSCTRVQFAAKACPRASVYGQATAHTPLLDRPLSGPVYLRASSNKLPDLVADLRGQIGIELVGRVDTTRQGGLRTSFEAIPDAPVSSFVLDLQGGAKGLLLNSVDLCKAKPRASVAMVAQNGKRTSERTRLQTSCGKGRAGKAAKR